MVNVSMDGDFARFSLNLDIYGLETLYSVGFQMSDYAYIYYYKGSADCIVVVNISYQDEELNTEERLLALAKDFMNHAINYNVYKFNAQRKHLFRSMLVQKIFDNPRFSAHLNRKTVPEEDGC